MDLKASLDLLFGPQGLWTKEEKLISKVAHPRSSRSRRNSVCLSARSQRAPSPTGIDRGRPVATPLNDLYTPRGILFSRSSDPAGPPEFIPRLPISLSVPAYSTSPRRGDLTTERSDLLSDRQDSRRQRKGLVEEAATAAQGAAVRAREKAAADELHLKAMQEERRHRSPARLEAMADLIQSPSFEPVESIMGGSPSEAPGGSSLFASLRSELDEAEEGIDSGGSSGGGTSNRSPISMADLGASLTQLEENQKGREATRSTAAATAAAAVEREQEELALQQRAKRAQEVENAKREAAAEEEARKKAEEEAALQKAAEDSKRLAMAAQEKAARKAAAEETAAAEAAQKAVQRKAAGDVAAAKLAAEYKAAEEEAAAAAKKRKTEAAAAAAKRKGEEEAAAAQAAKMEAGMRAAEEQAAATASAMREAEDQAASTAAAVKVAEDAKEAEAAAERASALAQAHWEEKGVTGGLDAIRLEATCRKVSRGTMLQAVAFEAGKTNTVKLGSLETMRRYRDAEDATSDATSPLLTLPKNLEQGTPSPGGNELESPGGEQGETVVESFQQFSAPAVVTEGASPLTTQAPPAAAVEMPTNEEGVPAAPEEVPEEEEEAYSEDFGSDFEASSSFGEGSLGALDLLGEDTVTAVGGQDPTPPPPAAATAAAAAASAAAGGKVDYSSPSEAGGGGYASTTVDAAVDAFDSGTDLGIELEIGGGEEETGTASVKQAVNTPPPPPPAAAAGERGEEATGSSSRAEAYAQPEEPPAAAAGGVAKAPLGGELPSLSAPVKKAGGSSLTSLFAQPFEAHAKAKAQILPDPVAKPLAGTQRPKKMSGLKGLTTVEDSSESSSDDETPQRRPSSMLGGLPALTQGARRGRPGGGGRGMDLSMLGSSGLGLGKVAMAEFEEDEIASESPEASPAAGGSSSPARGEQASSPAFKFEMDASDCFLDEESPTAKAPPGGAGSPRQGAALLGSVQSLSSVGLENKSIEVESDDSLEVEELFDDDF